MCQLWQRMVGSKKRRVVPNVRGYVARGFCYSVTRTCFALSTFTHTLKQFIFSFEIILASWYCDLHASFLIVWLTSVPFLISRLCTSVFLKRNECARQCWNCEGQLVRANKVAYIIVTKMDCMYIINLPQKFFFTTIIALGLSMNLIFFLDERRLRVYAPIL
jgi:hypothetical protein